MLNETPVTGGKFGSVPTPETARPLTRTSSADEFSGPNQSVNVKIPTDLYQSIKLTALDQNRRVSEVMFECLTGKSFIRKAWISTRKTA